MLILDLFYNFYWYHTMFYRNNICMIPILSQRGAFGTDFPDSLSKFNSSDLSDSLKIVVKTNCTINGSPKVMQLIYIYI